MDKLTKYLLIYCSLLLCGGLSLFLIYGTTIIQELPEGGRILVAAGSLAITFGVVMLDYLNGN